MIRQRKVASHDLIQHYVYLAENAGIEIAERFLQNAEASFNDLADQPMIGAPITLRHLQLASIRKWRIRDFDDYLIFYMPIPGGISIVRVLHAARDWQTVLDAGTRQG